MDDEAGLGRWLDEIATNATPAPRTTLIDGWLCKQAPDLPFRRANAVLPPIGAGRDPATTAGALAAIEDWYGATDQRILIQVSSADPAAADLDALLAARGYGIEAPVDLMIGDPRVVSERARPAARFCDVVDAWSKENLDGLLHRRSFIEVQYGGGCTEAWVNQCLLVHDDDVRSRERTLGYGRMLEGIGRGALACVAISDPAVFSDLDSSAPSDRRIAGIGFGVIQAEWAGLFGMYTAPSWRGYGVGSMLVQALAGFVNDHDQLQGLYLQVETDNAPAQALYRGLGFTRHHGYHYRASEPWRPTAGEPVDLGC